MWLRVKLAWIAFRYPQFAKWALDNAARECLVGRLTHTEIADVAREVAAAIDTKGRVTNENW